VGVSSHSWNSQYLRAVEPAYKDVLRTRNLIRIIEEITRIQAFKDALSLNRSFHFTGALIEECLNYPDYITSSKHILVGRFDCIPESERSLRAVLRVSLW
jgi:hypothetical protein